MVWGLGGAGKTQLVLDYVRRHRTEYRATFWLEAGRKESLQRDFVHLYHTLFVLQASVGAEAATVSVEDAVTGVKSWFSGRQGPWLMVFDGADAIDDSEASDFVNIRHFVPNVASLHVIITSRSSTAADMTEVKGVQVGEMEEAQAAELFHQYSELPREVVEIADEVRAITKELGHLALAVTLAATYVGSTPRLQSDIKAYLPEYRRRRRELLRRKPESLVHQYNESVLTTWETSYQAVVDRCPEAAVLMTILSFLNFDDIFLAFFNTDDQSRDSRDRVEADVESTENYTAEDEAGTSWRHIVSPERILDVYKIEECFAVLQRYSFVRWKADQQSYAMHELVHAWGHDRLSEEEQWKFSQATFGLVVKAVGNCGSTPGEKLRMVPHVMANFAAISSASSGQGRVTETLLYEMKELACFVRDLGHWGDGKAIERFILTWCIQIFGDEHLKTIEAMNSLSITLRVQGEYDEAAQMMKEVLDSRRLILGNEHPDTIIAMNNLAVTLRDQGELEEAAQIMKEVLEIRRQISGDNHLHTISAMNNLAMILRDQGELAESAKMVEQVLESRRQVLGHEHPSTLAAMSNLAITFNDRGELVKAANIEREVLEKRKCILGDDHIDTVKSMHNLAAMLRDQRDFNETVKTMREVVESRRRILSDTHPDTIMAMNDLAVTLGDQGELDKAARMMEEVLEKLRRILGDEHRYTETAAQNLAMLVHDRNLHGRTTLTSTRKRNRLKQLLLRGERRK